MRPPDLNNFSEVLDRLRRFLIGTVGWTSKCSYTTSGPVGQLADTITLRRKKGRRTLEVVLKFTDPRVLHAGVVFSARVIEIGGSPSPYVDGILLRLCHDGHDIPVLVATFLEIR